METKTSEHAAITSEKIPAVNLKAQYDSIRAEIDAAMRSVLERQAFILGPEVAELEKAVAAKHQCAHAIGCASGSDALLLSLMALGIGEDDHVIAPPFTFFATGGSIARTGAKPVFADIDPRTFNLSPAAVERSLESPKLKGRVKAIMPVHLYGQCADMDELLAIAKRHGLAIVEDAAQAILAHYKGRPAGSVGNTGCFSFFPTKNLGGFGDGGMITTNDGMLAQRLRVLRVHGAAKKYIHSVLGLNSRLDNLQAAILLAKIKHLDEWTRSKREKAATYRQALLRSGLCQPDAVYPSQRYPVALPYAAPDRDHVYHQFTLRVLRRDELALHLKEKGIETTVYYPVPLHVQEAFAYLGGKAGDCPESERSAAEALSIPVFAEITDQQQTRVVDEIKAFYAS